MKLIAWSKFDDHNTLMRIEYRGFFLFWRRHTLEVVGNCTVWHYYPSGRRAGTMIEGALCNLWQRIKWGTVDNLKIEREARNAENI